MKTYNLQYNKTHPSRLYTAYNKDITHHTDYGYTYTNDSTILDATLSGYASQSPVPSDEVKSKIFAIVDDVIELLFPKKDSIYMMGTEEAWPHLKMDTSAGVHYPGFTKREALHYTDEESIEIVNKRARDMFNHIKHNPSVVCDENPCVLAVKPKCYHGSEPALQDLRASEATQHIDTVKGRLIWVQPIEMSLFELCFYHPFYEYNRKNPISAMTMGVNTRARILRCSQDLRHASVSIDWSAFDQTVPSWIIHHIIRQLVHRLTIPQAFRNCDEDEYKQQITKILSSHFIHTQLVLPDGTRFKDKHKGIPSGSQGTQLIGTIANMSIITWLIETYKIRAQSLMCLGDDSYFEVEDDTVPPFYLMAQSAKEIFGMVMHPEKCIFNPPHTQIDFLGYAGSNGFLIVDSDKYEFKLRFLSQPMSMEHEIGRFISLFLMGGFALNSYQQIAQQMLQAPLKEFDDFEIPIHEANKLFYVFGYDPARLTKDLALDILATDPFLLSQGELTYGQYYKHRSPFTVKQLLARRGAVSY